MPFGIPDDEYERLIDRGRRAGITKRSIDAKLKALAAEDRASGGDGVISGVNEIPLSDFDSETDDALRSTIRKAQAESPTGSVIDLDPNADLL